MGKTSFELSHRAATLALGAMGLLATAARIAPGDAPTGAALRLWAGVFLVALLPGVALVLRWRPGPRMSVVDLLALGAAANLALVQLLTVLAVTLHLPARTMLLVMAIATLVLLGSTAARKDERPFVVWRHQLLLIGLLAIPAGAAYLLGTPYSYASGEDGTHIAVVRRLALLERPAIDNLYWAPGIVYTYPFPATHYLIALVSQASDLDPLFVYRKIRFLWAFEAQLFVFAAARLLFGSEKIALLTGIACAAFSLSGPFALVLNFEGQPFSWSQLVPQSHASDVAMNVCLPALLLVTFWLLRAQGRDRVILGALAATLVLMLTIVHVREAVQFFAYIGALVASAALLRRWNVAGGALAIGGGGMFVTLSYLAWHQRAVGHIDTFVRERRDLLVDLASGFHPADWLARPFLHPAFGNSLDSFFFSWFPFLLLLGPMLLSWRPRRPQVLLAFSSVTAYLLIVRLPLLTVPYIYLSYFEIMFTPVRNVVFFAYLMTGLGAALIAGLVCRWQKSWHRGLAIAVIALLGATAYTLAGPFLARWPARWLEFALLLHVGAWWLALRHPNRLPSIGALIRPAMRSGGVAVGGALVCLTAALTFSPRTSPLAIAGSARVDTEREALLFPVIAQRDVPFPYNPDSPERMGRHPSLRIPVAISTPPPPELILWSSRHLTLDATFAVNLLNRYSPAPFMPQQIAYWPHIDGSTGSYFRRIFPAYYKLLEASLARIGEQPFFNLHQDLTERVAFLKAVGATHVLVDPMYHGTLAPLLSSWPGAFRKQYDAGGWAVFELLTATPSPSN